MRSFRFAAMFVVLALMTALIPVTGMARTSGQKRAVASVVITSAPTTLFWDPCHQTAPNGSCVGYGQMGTAYATTYDAQGNVICDMSVSICDGIKFATDGTVSNRQGTNTVWATGVGTGHIYAAVGGVRSPAWTVTTYVP